MLYVDKLGPAKTGIISLQKTLVLSAMTEKNVLVQKEKLKFHSRQRTK